MPSGAADTDHRQGKQEMEVFRPLKELPWKVFKILSQTLYNLRFDAFSKIFWHEAKHVCRIRWVARPDLWVFWSEGWVGASATFFPSSTFKSRFILTAYFVTSDKEKKFTCCSCDSFLWRKFDVGGARRSAASNLSTGLRSTGWTWDLKDLLLSLWVLLL